MRQLVPGIFAALDTNAAEAGVESVRQTSRPGIAVARWTLDAGHRIHPFSEVLPADSPQIAFDHYPRTPLGFI